MGAGIPDKLYFKIGEVAELVSLRPSVLRYWETEFELLKPSKSRAGQRLYTKKELELLLEIKKLLYTEKLTIEGARKRINGKVKRGEVAIAGSEFAPDSMRKVLAAVREELVAIRNSLQDHHIGA
ncbi:MAG: MerR family transcriptional regulator [Geobacteraceae bacterium]|nr:MerR family transcriptional regulator [Geobacteraceae bacterium]